VNTASSRPSRVTNYPPADDRDEATAPKFVPPTSEPTAVDPNHENTVGA
jgi:hypothetical protein